jgi:hypothetical protein
MIEVKRAASAARFELAQCLGLKLREHCPWVADTAHG